jgi:phenylacetate-coenzyme A ligase PaaK-like adenylate-forming protein
MTSEPPIVAGFDRLRVSVQEQVLARAPDYIERLKWPRAEIETRQREGLRALLRHAIEHSPFHRRRLRGVDPERFELSDLTSLPVMTKPEMMRSLTDVFTDRRISRQLVEDALARTSDTPVPILGRYTAWASGGSSGQRGVFLYDLEATVGIILSVTRSLIARLHDQGGVPRGGVPIAFVSAVSAVHATRSACAWTASGRLPFRFLTVPATLPLIEIVARLNALQAPALFGYPSMLARLAAEKHDGRLCISPTMVTTSGETLTAELKTAINQAFKAPIVDTFASSEGLVGTTAPDDDVQVLNSDLCIVELVDAANRPVPAGVPSAKVLLTNLYNLTQPLVRYELSDCFIEQPDSPDHGHLRVKVRGRADEILHYGPIDIHPHVVRSVMVKTADVFDYQVRQTIDGIAIDAVAADAIDAGELRDSLSKALAAAGLASPVVTIRMVSRLQRDTASGKLKKFVPLQGMA